MKYILYGYWVIELLMVKTIEPHQTMKYPWITRKKLVWLYAPFGYFLAADSPWRFPARKIPFVRCMDDDWGVARHDELETTMYGTTCYNWISTYWDLAPTFGGVEATGL